MEEKVYTSARWTEQHASVFGGKVPRILPGCFLCKWNTNIWRCRLLIRTVYESSHRSLDIYYMCFYALSTSLCQRLEAWIHMKACAGWRWSYMAMCSSMPLVSTNADCFDTSCQPSVAIEQTGTAPAKLQTDIQLLFRGEVSMTVWERANQTQTCNFRNRGRQLTDPRTDGELCCNMQDWSWRSSRYQE